MLDVINGVNNEFILPEKWCLKCTEPLFIEYCNENGVNKGTYTERELSKNYAHFPPVNGQFTTDIEITYGYTEITFEQFKKYVSLL